LAAKDSGPREEYIARWCAKKIRLSAVADQQMRTKTREFGLAGAVESIKTTVVDISKKSYKILPDGARDTENCVTSSGVQAESRLWQSLKFDVQGRLVEDVDLERPYDEDNSYRFVRVYDPQGLLIERAGYREDGSPQQKHVYKYSPERKKIEELHFYGDGGLKSRTQLDEHNNPTAIEWYAEDGTIQNKESPRYEYVSKANTLEQLYYPPQRPNEGGLVLEGASGSIAEVPVNEAGPVAFRTLFVHDDTGQRREELRYLPGGLLFEKRIFDHNGILRSHEFRISEICATTTVFDDLGRVTESHTVAKNAGTTTPTDFRTFYAYEEHGNLSEVIVKGADGALIARTTNVFEYDDNGNWIAKTENNSQIVLAPAVSETVLRFHRTISYFRAP
jgi:antitoxin component YwqK of YwqJK toxin-antitoxin module